MKNFNQVLKGKGSTKHVSFKLLAPKSNVPKNKFSNVEVFRDTNRHVLRTNVNVNSMNHLINLSHQKVFYYHCGANDFINKPRDNY